MTLLLCLNELSYRDVSTRPEDVDAAIRQLVALILEVRRHRTDTALVAEAAFSDLGIGDTAAFQRWQADGRNRDMMRVIRAQRTRAPFALVISPDDESSTEYQYGGAKADGLGAAHLLGGLAVSLALAPQWDADHLQLQCQKLVESDDGNVELQVTDESVRHSTSAGHVSVHSAWMTESGLAHVHTGPAIWEIRDDVFPHLRFLPRVADDLAALPRDWIKPVKNLLAEFEDAVSRWDSSHSIAPVWPGKVTPEHERRRSESFLHDPEVDAQVRFDVHARFTPRAGRMHFRWDAETSKAVIGYIGHKRD